MNQARLGAAVLAALLSVGLVCFLSRSFLIELALANPLLFLVAAVAGVAVGRLSSLRWAFGLILGDGLVVASYGLMWLMYGLAGVLPDLSPLAWLSWTLLVSGGGLIIGTLSRSVTTLKRALE